MMEKRPISPVQEIYSTGQLLGQHYRIQSPLAEGGFSKLYEAVDLRDGKRVVLKTLLRAAMLDDEAAYQRFVQEAEVSTLLEHPNIVRTLDFGRDEQGYPFLVMERLQGQTLDQLIDAGAQPESRVRHIVEALLRALDAVHRHGVVHRDLKPANVFVCPQQDGSEQVKLIDFGLAKVYEFSPRIAVKSLTLDGMMVGTPGYIAPELFAGAAPSPQADLYVLGIIAYELLVGASAYQGNALQRTRQQGMHNPPVPKHLKRSRFFRFVEELLARDPLRRFVSANDALQALAELDAASAADTESMGRGWSGAAKLVSAALLAAALVLAALLLL